MDMDEILSKIKEYADIAVDQAGKLGKAAASKTENVVSKAKIKYVINETEGQIKAIYTVLGEKVYLKYLEGEGNITGDWAEDCEKITGLNEELDALKLQLDNLNDGIKCNECGAFNSPDSAFCSKCGSKLATEESAEPETEDTAENAGADEEAAAEAVEEIVEEAAAVVENYG